MGKRWKIEGRVVGFCFAVAFGALGAVPTDGDPIRLQSGDYELFVDPAAAWTIDSIRFDGTVVGQNNGHYGTVFAETGYEWIGTGHSEGGVERVTNLVLTVDGTVLGEPIPGTTYSGTNITLVKGSQLGNLDEEFTLNLTPERIAEKVTLTPASDQYVDKLYAFMHIFPTNTTDWIAQAGTTTYQGTLKNNKSWNLKKDVNWVAIYNPVDELGVLVSYAELYDTDDSDIKTGILDHPAYHKLYFKPLQRERLSVGQSYTWAMTLRIYPATESEWRDKARDLNRIKNITRTHL